MKFNRRRFLQAFGAAAATAATPSVVRSNTNATSPVVVVGGGFAGATVAKYLRMWSDNTIDVTLIDPNAHHTSCVMSNLVLNGRLRLRELELSYDSLRNFYGVNVVRGRVTGVDSVANEVVLEDGSTFAYERLVIATGIEFDAPAGTDFSKTPHAWIAGPQTTLLANKVNALSAGGSFVMTIPKSPYRCPPGPYERACLVADILKRKGGGTVTVLDANDGIQAEAHTFSKAFNELYGDIIDYQTNVAIASVGYEKEKDFKDFVETGSGKISGDVVNIIAPQRALGFVREAGLTGGGDWAGVDPLTYQSTVPDFEKVHIIGDSQGSGQPKSAHMASSQAKVCADAIIRILADLPIDSEERVKNITTNSACYSPITYDEASWLTANFKYDVELGQMVLARRPLGEADHWSKDNYEEMFAWASNLFTDSFH